MATNANKYAYWARINKVINTFSKVFMPLFVICTVLIVAGFILRFGLNVAPDQYLPIVLAPFTIWMVLTLEALNAVAKSKMKKNVDPRFGPREYAFTLEAMRSVGISNPVQYVMDHPHHVEAYKRVLKVAQFSLEYPIEGTFISGDKQILIDEHRVAALVLPGDAELSREQKIISLMKDRGLKQYKAIKEIIEQSDEQPLPLLNGAL